MNEPGGAMKSLRKRCEIRKPAQGRGREENCRKRRSGIRREKAEGG